VVTFSKKLTFILSVSQNKVSAKLLHVRTQGAKLFVI
jgi:hypothetical protein